MKREKNLISSQRKKPQKNTSSFQNHFSSHQTLKKSPINCYLQVAHQLVSVRGMCLVSYAHETWRKLQIAK